MKAAIIGATGFVGGQILAEALMRPQLEITAIVRNIGGLAPHERLTAARCDILDTNALTAALRGHDAVIHAFHPGRDLKPEEHEQNLAGHKSIIAAAKAAAIPRLLAVGGAASLKTSDGLEYIDSPFWDSGFDPYKPAILNTRALYYLLKEERDLDWVCIAPSSMLRPGERTTRFRYGKDDLLYDKSGESRISIEDYAYAMIEELVEPQHHRERFTVGY